MNISLLSDLGYKDSLVGVVRGILLKAVPQATIIDITHDIVPFHSLECSYLMKKSIPYFPKNTIHICLFGVPLKEVDHWLLLVVNDQYILCADNGVLPLSFPEYMDQVYEIPLEPESFIDCVQQISFQLADWKNEGINWPSLRKIQPDIMQNPLEPTINDKGIQAQVLHIDHFGNVVYNLQKKEFYEYFQNRKFIIQYGAHEKVNSIVTFYEDVNEGVPLFRFNDFGYLEFAVNKGSAAELYGYINTPKLKLVYSTIKIIFDD